MRIVLVDEDKKDMPLLCEELESAGHRVCQAKCENEVKALADTAWDAAIVDLMMPVEGEDAARASEAGFLGGLYLFRRYLYRSEHPIPFVILTAVAKETYIYSQGEMGARALEGFRGVIGKPCTADDIIVLLREQ